MSTARKSKLRRCTCELLEGRKLLSTTYYVSPSGADSNAGTSGVPWKTLQKAANTAVAGDIVHVGAGTYTSGMNFFGKAGGTSAHPIEFLADAGAIVTHCATSGLPNDSLAAINVENTNGWYVFQGFTINSDGSMQRAGIRVTSSDNTQVLDNTVHSAFIGIFASNSSNLLIQGNTCTNSTDQHGIYVSLNTHNCVIRGNTLTGNNWDGLHMNALNGSPNDGALVEDNVIYSNGLAGMDLEGLTNAVFRNNIIYSNGKHGITIHSQDQANTPVASNNTFVNNTIANNSMFGIQIKPEDMQGETLFNNIFYSTSSIYGSIGVSGTPTGLVSDYNIVVDNFSLNLGTSKITFAQWKSQTGEDMHSVVATASQLFVNAGANNYQLKSGSLAIDMGTSTVNARSAPTTDFSGNSRPQGSNWDAGAYEFPSADTTAPIISLVATSNLSSNSVTITWSTNEAATALVEYGTTTNYGSSSVLNGSFLTTHSVTLTGLNSSTLYHFHVKSSDAAANQGVSADFTLTTPAPPDTTAPTASASAGNITTSGVTSNSISVTYNDDNSVDTSTLDGADVLVTGPNGFSHVAAFVKFTGSGAQVTATYSIDAPGGGWSNGTYNLSIVSGQAKDASGNAVAAGTIGSFTVNVPPPITGNGVITGSVFNDVDANGAKNGTDGNLAGWLVYLDANNNGKLDKGEVNVRTNSKGVYTLSGLADGSYRIRQVIQSGYRQTSPGINSFWQSSLAKGIASKAGAFGNTQKVLIGGTIFKDVNGDRIQQPGEPGLAGWTAYIDTNNNGKLDSGEKSVLTDANGRFSFIGDPDVRYIIRMVANPKYQLTTGNKALGVDLAAGKTRTNLLFGQKSIA